jgi:hypothetical protein
MKRIFSSETGLFFSLQKLLLSNFIVLFTIILAVIFYWYYTFATQQAEAQLKKDLTQGVQIVALNIDGDELLALAQNGQPNAAGRAWRAAETGGEPEPPVSQGGPPNPSGFSDDPRYQRVLNWLDTVHQIEPRAWPYLWVQGATDKELIYVVDLMARYNPVKSTLFLDREVYDEPQIQTDLELSVDDAGNLASYQDQWGQWYSAWLPLENAGGELIGGIGLDFEAGEVEQVQQLLRNRILIAFGVTYLILFLVVYGVSRSVTRPIAALTRAAALVGEGQYEQEFSTLYGGPYFHNEINILARVFDAMVSKVYQREQNLQHQVEELRIEIDDVKRQREVAEIVESDFFRDLQIKARDMRRRHADEAGSGDEPE